MKENVQLAIRTDVENPNHHLWNNNGTWFIHYTIYPTTITKERVRKSLHTKNIEDAREKRDHIFNSLMAG